MDFDDMESALQDAGIDPFDFSLMDGDERRQALEDALFDPMDFEDFDLEYGSSYAVAFKSASGVKPASKPSAPPVQLPPPMSDTPDTVTPAPTMRWVQNDGVDTVCEVDVHGMKPHLFFRADEYCLQPGDRVLVPFGSYSKPVAATVVSVKIYHEAPASVTQSILGRAPKEEKPEPAPAPAVREAVHPAETTTPSQGGSSPRWILWLLLAVSFLMICMIIPAGQFSKPAPTATPRPSVTVRPTPKPKPSPAPTVRPKATPHPSGLRVGMKLSRDVELYYLGGGGTIDGVSTWRYRYLAGTTYYVVYLDSDRTVKRIEDYTPQTSSKKSRSGKVSDSSSDPFHASDYAHPEDFYDWYKDDFWDYEDAEDYWEEHN